jgi:phospholipid/cholesterol/gamma-HCH transport system substrate-binding protein
VRRHIKNHLVDFLAIVALLSVAGVVAVYILDNQRLRFPFVEPEPFVIKGEFATAQAVTPGQGQTVRVAGIRVGDIAKTELEDGRAIITMELDEKFDDVVRTDAKALLRPKTGLKDMFVELDPGTKDAPLAKKGFTVPIANTLPDVNPDEILASLDTDTRDYLRLLLEGGGRGLKGRSDDLREVLRRFEPTYRDLALVSSEVGKRREELRRLVNSLQRLNTELGSRDDDLAQLVDSSATVFRAFANERENVSSTVRELPSALREAGDSLERVETMAQVLRPTADKLRPAVRALDRANRATRPFVTEAAPQLRQDIRPFVREARPVVRDLRPAADDLVASEPRLKRSFKVFNHLFNMLAHNPRGAEGPGAEGRDEGYLFWLAWVGHQTNNLFGNADAHGPGRPFTTGGTCTSFQQTVELQPELEEVLGLSGVLTDPRVCGNADGSAGPLPELPSLPLPRKGKG